MKGKKRKGADEPKQPEPKARTRSPKPKPKGKPNNLGWVGPVSQQGRALRERLVERVKSRIHEVDGLHQVGCFTRIRIRTGSSSASLGTPVLDRTLAEGRHPPQAAQASFPCGPGAAGQVHASSNPGSSPGVSVCVQYTRPLDYTPPGPSGISPAAGPSGSSPAADPSGSSSSNKRQPDDISSGLADERTFQFDPATRMGMGLDPGAIQAVSAASGVWDGDGCLDSFIRSKLTRSQVQHDSGLIQARHNTQRWNENIKLELQHLAAATPTGTSLVAIQRHVAFTLATYNAVWEEYLHPKWAAQLMRLHGAQEKVLERYFKKLEEVAAVESQKRGTRKQLVVFFGNAGIGTRGGWGAKAVLQACRKVVERPNSGKPTKRVPSKVVTVDEFRTSRVSCCLHQSVCFMPTSVA
ncbi:hypothetical protein QJQ45_010970 [Haematococcus lacustris]|nr:hypothetical protein QJQ45_010970 [Haematococcus lacustris]